MFDDFFVQRLIDLRLEKGVSAHGMSIALGQNGSYIREIENRKNLPSMMSFFYICDYFGITPKEFFDTEVKNPTLLNDFIAASQKLNDDKIRHLLNIAEDLNIDKNNSNLK
ncbi:MAG: helix-turn-helix domain-containing protein [Clostridiales bacterium]|jgi:transcriptional regulator with XRE-family HTH domain|nr:helix-turn-helix domain-containing protein [Clostridiales bacterium]